MDLTVSNLIDLIDGTDHQTRRKGAVPSKKQTQLDTSGLLPPLTLPNLLKTRFTANISHPLQNFNAACMPTFVFQVLNATHNDCMIYTCVTRIQQQRPLKAWHRQERQKQRHKEGGFQVVYPLGLWSRFSGVVKVLYGYG